MYRLAGLLCLTLLATPAFAQPTSLIIDQARADRAAPPKTTQTSTLSQPKPEDRIAGIRPFALGKVLIEGASLPPAILDAASRIFIGRSVDAQAIAEIAKRVSQAYADSGDVALYTVTVPGQDFAGGVLRLIVTEGYIEHVYFHGDVDGGIAAVTTLAQKLTRERPLRRSTLQRYLSLMRDLPGLTIDAQFLRGDAPGAVQLSITLTQKKYQLALNLNDAGNSLLGEVQAQADLSLYNLLREGEETVLSFGTSAIFSRFQYYALSDTEPLDDEGTRATASYGYLRTDVPRFSVSGDAQTAQFAVSHAFIRGYDENLSAVASVDGIDLKNTLLGSAIANEAVRAARLSTAYSLTDPRYALTLDANVGLGLGIFDAHVANPATADTSFRKLVVQGSYNHLLGDAWILRLRAASQIAFDRLPVSELYPLGGPTFGRAFASASALGDDALAGSAEIGFNPDSLPAFLAGAEIFGFGDDGDSWYRARPSRPAIRDELASAGFGIRIPLISHAKLELQLADAIRSDLPETAIGEWRFLFALTANY